MDNLVNQGLLGRASKGSFTISKMPKGEQEVVMQDVVKPEEVNKSPGADFMYMKMPKGEQEVVMQDVVKPEVNKSPGADFMYMKMPKGEQEVVMQDVVKPEEVNKSPGADFMYMKMPKGEQEVVMQDVVKPEVNKSPGADFMYMKMPKGEQEVVMQDVVKPEEVNKSPGADFMYMKMPKGEQEVIMQDVVKPEEVNKSPGADFMYMKALYHALPMDYVTVAKLHNKLDGEANQNTVRKLIDRMIHEGFVKNSTTRRLGPVRKYPTSLKWVRVSAPINKSILGVFVGFQAHVNPFSKDGRLPNGALMFAVLVKGKQVIHSEISNKKLLEVKKKLEVGLDNIVSQAFEFDDLDNPKDKIMRDGSAIGGIHSLGSDQTRTRERSEIQNNNMPSAKDREQSHTPMSMREPSDSLESGVLREKVRGRVHGASGGDDTQSNSGKRTRKSSTVEEPILQYAKRIKAEVP